jgi:hypothetical protein
LLKILPWFFANPGQDFLFHFYQITYLEIP